MAKGKPADAGDQLVVLVSNYPGWRVLVDGQPATLQPVNDYLGAPMQTGEHTYTFVFRPMKHYLGLAISLLALATMLGLVLIESPLWPRFTKRNNQSDNRPTIPPEN
ncbi:MAG: hypothetical protein P8183_04430 [Anaerolineae bacterium]